MGIAGKFRKQLKTICDTLNGQIDSYNVSETKSIRARGIVNGKFGVAITNIEDKNTPQYLVDSILATGKYIEKEEDAIIFEGSKKYTKRNVFNKELDSTPLEEKLFYEFNLDITSASFLRTTSAASLRILSSLSASSLSL